MITEHDLQEAIAECEGQRNPSASTCLKLAAFYTIKDKMYPALQEDEKMKIPQYSYQGPVDDIEPRTEFLQMIDHLSPAAYLPIMDELMSTVRALIPNLYDGVMRRLDELN